MLGRSSRLSYEKYTNALFKVLSRIDTCSNYCRIGTAIRAVPEVYTENDKTLLEKWKKFYSYDSNAVVKKLALLLAKELEHREDLYVLETYVKEILPWLLTLNYFFQCTTTGLEILTVVDKGFVASESLVLLPLLECLTFSGKLINCKDTLQKFKNHHYISNACDTRCKLIVTCVTSDNFNDLDFVINEEISSPKTAYLFATIAIILMRSDKQIEFLKKLWASEKLDQYEKADVYKKYGASIFSAIMLANPYTMPSLIEWFQMNENLRNEMNVKKRLYYFYEHLFLLGNSDDYNVDDGFGSYSNDDEDDDTSDDVHLQVGAVLMMLVFGGRKQNLEYLFNEVATICKPMDFDGVINLLFTQLYTEFNNAGNMVNLLEMDLLYPLYLPKCIYVDKNYAEYLWDLLIPQGVSARENILFKIAWIFFHVSFRSINTIAVMDFLWSKLEFHNKVCNALFSESILPEYRIIRDTDYMDQNWLSVRLCEVAAIRRDRNILEWFWEKTENHPEKDDVRLVALTKGVWAFGKAVENHDYEMVEWIWHKVSILDKTLLINLLINNECYQPNLEWVFMKLMNVPCQTNSVLMLNWVFDKIDYLHRENIYGNHVLCETLKTSLEICFRKGCILQDKNAVMIFLQEIQKWGGKELLKLALFGENIEDDLSNIGLGENAAGVDLSNSICNKINQFIDLKE